MPLNNSQYNAIIRSYEEKQRYNLELSERYLKAVERYNRENALSFAH